MLVTISLSILSVVSILHALQDTTYRGSSVPFANRNVKPAVLVLHVTPALWTTLLSLTNAFLSAAMELGKITSSVMTETILMGMVAQQSVCKKLATIACLLIQQQRGQMFASATPSSYLQAGLLTGEPFLLNLAPISFTIRQSAEPNPQTH